MKRLCILVFPASVGFFATDARAVDFYEEHRGWVVGAADSSCGMTMEYEGPGATELTLLKDIDGEIVVGVTNSNWSAVVDEKYDVSFVLNDTAYGGGTAVGYKTGYRKGFMLGLNGSFEEDFRRGSTLWIYLGETKIDQLSLAGTTIALSAVNRCLKLVKAEKDAEAREKARWSSVPEDPFANSIKATDRGLAAKPATPSGNPGRWITSNDYPSQALREGREGVVTITLMVSPFGIPSSCEVTASSGHDDLDALTCTNMMRRARFDPARNDQGEAIEAGFTQSIRWQIPEPPPPPPEPVNCVAGEICRR